MPAEERKVLTAKAHKIANAVIVKETATRQWTRTLDKVLLHPLAGPLILFGLLFVMFQSVFAWSEAPIGWIETGIAMLSDGVASALPEGFFRSLIIEGVLAGVGSVVVFLPQILILFLFILILESTGYMTRAAFVMDRMMASVGLSGHSFIPLLSSFACAIPGIMATRTIMDQKDRLTTILIAPLMTCSARLPVYTVIIGAFIPATRNRPGYRAARHSVVRALYRRDSRCDGRGLVPSPHCGQGQQQQLSHRNAALSIATAPRYRHWALAARLGFSSAGRHDHLCLDNHPVGAVELPQGSRRQRDDSERIFGRRAALHRASPSSPSQSVSTRRLR